MSRIHTAYIGEYLHFRYLKFLVISSQQTWRRWIFSRGRQVDVANFPKNFVQVVNFFNLVIKKMFKLINGRSTLKQRDLPRKGAT